MLGSDVQTDPDQPVDEKSPVADPRAWGVCWLMFAATVLTYMDRQTVSLLGEPIKSEFRIASDADYGWILSAFYVTYALFQVFAGFLVDRWDLRWTYAMAVGWWSLAAAATAVVPGLGWLIACRALLGVGESFNWPVALRVTARVLPPSDRGLGNGIFNSGAAIGAVITPAVVTYLTVRSGWRSSFVVMGASGFVWVAAWLWLVRGELRRALAAPPREAVLPGSRRGRLSPGAASAFAATLVVAAAIAMGGFRFGFSAVQLGIAVAIVGPLLVAVIVPRDDLDGVGWAASLGEVVRNRRFWILAAVSVTINVCWHFQVSWIPTYLKQERHLKFEAGNYLSTIPFLAADVGNLAGGWWSRRLAAGGRPAGRARLIVMAVAMPMILVGLGIGRAADVPTALALLSVIAAGTTAFMANYFAFTQEVAPRQTGVVVGYLGALGNLAAAGFHPFAGALKDVTGTFAPVFVIIGLAPLVGLSALALGWGADRRPDPVADAG